MSASPCRIKVSIEKFPHVNTSIEHIKPKSHFLLIVTNTNSQNVFSTIQLAMVYIVILQSKLFAQTLGKNCCVCVQVLGKFKLEKFLFAGVVLCLERKH